MDMNSTMQPTDHSGSSSSSPSSLLGDEPLSSASEVESNPLHSHPVDELDGHEEDPIVVCGFALKFPDEATSPDGLWNMMLEKRCASSEFPSERVNIDGFHQKNSRLNTMQLKGGHFIKEDPALFDADFFSISPTEAASLDPQQRWLLEVAYAALENAGISMEEISGTSTAVYTGAFGFDYLLQLCRDSENPALYAALGFGISMLANRLSWFFNLEGPSIGVDSACSSTAMALDFACQSLQSGSCETVMLAGCNLASAPETFSWMSNIGFLSPDSRCYSFDSRANGYARGEGISVMILKKLSDAIRDGNTIRAVIRATGSNEDGKTPGITQPSRQAQERLIFDTYRKAGLSMEHTRFFEAHGTGTAIGDPREAQAIGTSFRKYRSVDDPLYVGALKSNIGHLEGASGIAGLIKAILALERGVIPPNANFERVNPKIDRDFLRIKFPLDAEPWPTSGLRRASVNSFGYGGANSHVVLDDAYNYLRLRGLNGRHCTAIMPPRGKSAQRTSAHLQPRYSVGDATTSPPKLLVFSSTDKNGTSRITKSLEGYHLGDKEGNELLGDLAYTLDSHRSRLAWRSCALIQSLEDLDALSSRATAPTRAKNQTPRIGFVFSGQGAQWYAMGRELLQYYSFEAELDRAGIYLKGLGCSWLPKDELLRPESESNVDKGDFSQTLCTILQVALVNLLRRFNVLPSAVAGHSSGEIAAAYASGAISYESAWKVAYYRGLCSAQLSQSSERRGLMASVGLSEEEARAVINSLDTSSGSFGLSIACINSPNNVTISGDEHLIDLMIRELDEKVFARKLRVPLAYHSPQMEGISTIYTSLIGPISKPEESVQSVPMISSVTGKLVSPQRLMEPSYWAQNLVSPVQFYQAISAMVLQGEVTKKLDGSHKYVSVVDHLLELGPHAALQAPIRGILGVSPRGSSISYSSALRRGKPATDTLMLAVGNLWCMGLSVNLRAVNEPQGERSRSMLVNLPSYPFDHSQRYWHESRLSKNYRLRNNAPTELLGIMTPDSNATEARWRHFIRLNESPWAEQHVINGRILYPAAGMLVMGIEAAKQLNESREITGFTLTDVRFENPIDLSSNRNGAEVETSLIATDVSDHNAATFKFTIRSFTEDQADGRINCRGTVTVGLSDSPDASSWEKAKTLDEREEVAREFSKVISTCETAVDSERMYKYLEESGYGYGPAYQGAQRQRCADGHKDAAAEISLFSSTPEPHVIHPASLDAIFHLAFTALTSGGKEPMATSIPSRIGCLWVSNGGLSSPENEKITACVSLSRSTKRTQIYTGGALGDSESNQARVWYEDFETTNVTSVPSRMPDSLAQTNSSSSIPDHEHFPMTISMNLALDKLDTEQITSLLGGENAEETDRSKFQQDVEVLCFAALENLVANVDYDALSHREPWVEWYWNWTKHHLNRLRPLWNDPDSPLARARTDESFEQLCDRIRNENDLGSTYAAVAANLPGLIKGETTPLELLMETGILDKFYRELGSTSRGAQAFKYIDFLAHQRPGLKILEVGGGTASTTRGIIKALESGPSSSGTLRCSRYDFTDVSSAFLEHARTEFSAYQSQMTFGTVDIEKDMVDQGYEEASYDVVVADNVLHATLDLQNTLSNIRRVLKPGGKLLMHELLTPDGWSFGLIFGLFPGWWLGADKGRDLSPLINAEGWDSVLKDTGFTGTDIVLGVKDLHHLHRDAYIVGSASAEAPALQSSEVVPEALIIIDSTIAVQHHLAQALSLQLQENMEHSSRVVHLEAIQDEGYIQNPEQLVISLLDYGSPFLATIDETKYSLLRNWIPKSNRIVWVSSGGGKNPNPDYSMNEGFQRTLRFERYDLQLVNVALELQSFDHTKAAQQVIQVASDFVNLIPGDNYEQDFVEIDGLLHTRRLNAMNHVKEAMDERLLSTKDVAVQIDQINFELSSSPSLGHDEGLHWAELPANKESLRHDEVDIRIEAISFQAATLAKSLVHNDHPVLPKYCAGRVLHSGSDAQSAGFQPGDRVLVPQFGTLKSQLRVSSGSVFPIPGGVSLDACVSVSTLAIAHHALDQIARVRASDSVLIHQGASPIGQAAIRVLRSLGVTDIWTTVRDGNEHSRVTQQLAMSEDRILPGSWFASTSLSSSRWKQRFDIVLSPYSNSETPHTMSSVRPGGHYIMLPSESQGHNYGQNLRDIPSSITLSIFDLESELPSSNSIRYATEALKNIDLVESSSDVTQYSASELVAAFSRPQQINVKDIAYLSLNGSDNVKVRVQNKPTYELRSDATYLIVGLGGLGRELARWLVRRGARSLLLLSRSGTKKTETREIMAEFQEQGVNVECPSCDVTDRGSVRSVLAQYSETMPPVVGCIQTAMNMTERVYETLTFDQWTSNVDPKVKASWNLHLEFPSGLDFFVLMSSVMGILGSESLSAYNAGNTFQDALARYRASLGEHGVAIDLGPVPDSGYVADALARDPEHILSQFKSNVFSFTWVKHICALLDICCDPAGSLFRTPADSQIIVGLRPPGYWKHLEEPPTTLNQPFWGHLHHIPLLKDESDDSPTAEGKNVDVSKKLAAAQTPAEISEVASEALATRVAVILGADKANIELESPMDSYGLDSLSAIQLRNWVGTTLHVDLPVFEILGGTTFLQAGTSIARKIQAQ